MQILGRQMNLKNKKKPFFLFPYAQINKIEKKIKKTI